MQNRFPLFSTPIDLAHSYWKLLLKPGDVAIDATCGNGKDTLVLAQLVAKEGKGTLIGIDLQPSSLERTRTLLNQNLSLEEQSRVHLFCQSHATFPDLAQKKPIKLIVYNLGYLPGGDKQITTSVNSTLKSLQEALALLDLGGAISLTCYPGHPEGAKELEALLEFFPTLDSHPWSICHHQWLNRPFSPTLFLLQKTTC